MAASGAVLLLFVLGHLAGNLLIFAGPDALNAYAKKLLQLGPGLWAARLFLLTALILHIVTSIKLSLENKKARPVAYKHKPGHEESSTASRTMMISGLLTLSFIIYHLLHFTFRVTHPEISHMKDALGRHNVYAMVVLSFKSRPVALAYIAAMIFLAAHLSHGISSMTQTLGLTCEKTIPLFKRTAKIITVLIFIGYISIPVAILTGWISSQGLTP